MITTTFRRAWAILPALYAFSTPGFCQSSPALTTIHRFAGSPGDGANPYAPLSVGKSGVLYGVTSYGGSANRGAVYSLAPPQSPGSYWSRNLLYSFAGGSDGANPTFAGLAIGSDGTLFGTTNAGGSANLGTVFSLTPPSSPGGAWTGRILYSFAGGRDGASPASGLIVASDGTMYGSTVAGGESAAGASGAGTVFSLAPPASPGASWTETVIYTFTGSQDGAAPYSTLALGSAGELYGTTDYGGPRNVGTVFCLTPPLISGGPWTKTTLYMFTGADGSWPLAGLMISDTGVLYGTTEGGGSSGRGTVYSLAPPAVPGDPWTESVLYSFTGLQDGDIPLSGLVRGIGGLLYGSTEYGGRAGSGAIYSLTPPASPGGSWLQSVIYSFTGVADGGWPVAVLASGPSGEFYGTTCCGGVANAGTIYELQPATYNISGQVTLSGAALAGVTVTLSGDRTASAMTDSTGNYSFAVPANGAYAVTPALASYSFTPSSQAFASLTAAQTANFTATTYTVSGQVTLNGAALPGVSVFLSGSLTAESQTDSLGAFTWTVPAGGVYTVTPSLPGYNLTPPSITFNALAANQTANFSATPLLNIYIVAGQVTLEGAGLPGVTIALSGSATASLVTDASGNFSFSASAGGSYTVTPSLPGQSFIPPSRIFTALNENQPSNFVLATNAISGYVLTRSGVGVSGVLVTLGGASNASTTTSTSGAYSFTVPNGAYTVTPWRPAYRFTPTAYSFDQVVAAQTAGFQAAVPHDFNGDGRTDLVWEAPSSGFTQVWYLGGAQGASLSAAANLTQANPWQIVGSADFDGDGSPDLVWQDPLTGAVQVWYLGGGGGVDLLSAANITAKNGWRVVSVADFNRDGHPDLLWQSPTSGFAQIWYLGGDRGLSLLGADNLTLSNPWQIVGSADFNGDGFPDVLWQDPLNGTVQIWYLNGSRLQSAANLTVNAWRVAAIADLDLDGHPDLVFQDPLTGAASVSFYSGAQGTTPNGAAVLSGKNPWRIAGPH